MNKKTLTLLLLLLVSILLSLAFCPPIERLLNDRDFFRYTGYALLRGQVPYRDFFDHKPPLIFFFNAAGLFFGRWGFWAIDALLALLVTERLYRRSEQYHISLPWLLPLLFNLMLRDNLISLGIGLTREFTTFFILLFFCVLLGKDKYKHFWMGLLTGLTFFMQQDQLLPLLPFIAYALLASDKVAIPTKLLRMAGGFVVILAPIIVYFAVNHSLSYFWQDAFAFNFSVYTGEKKSMGEHFRTIKRVLDLGNYEVPVLISLVLGIYSTFLPNKKKALTLLSLTTLLLFIAPEFMGGRPDAKGQNEDFMYYFLPLCGAVTMILFCVFAFLEEPVLSSPKAMWPYALLLCASLGYTAIQHAANPERYDNDYIYHVPEYAYLKKLNLGDYQLFVFGNDDFNSYYPELKILAPSRWIYHHFWEFYPRWDADCQQLKSIGDDLLRHHTHYILMGADIPGRLLNPIHKTWWNNFLNSYYRQVTIDGRPSSVWQLK